MAKLGTNLNCNNVSKLTNMPASSAAGQAVEHQQFVDALADKMNLNNIKTSINATTGQVLDAPTIKSYVDVELSNLINSAPAEYDTLKELADWVNTHQDLYDALVTTVSNKIAQSSITTDITTANAGEVPDAEALNTYLNATFDTSNLAKMQVIEIANTIADTPYLINHGLNLSRSKIMTQLKDVSGEEVFADVSAHETEPLDKFYITTNADYANLKLLLVYK